jgi:hypothetical protein
MIRSDATRSYAFNSPADLEALREEIARRVLEHAANENMTPDEITRAVLSSFGIVRPECDDKIELKKVVEAPSSTPASSPTESAPPETKSGS